MTPAWIAADWGGTNLRVWAMGDSGEVLAEAVSDAGAGSLYSVEFEPALLALIGPWLPESAPEPTLVLICGMAGGRQGWREAAYLKTPCAPLAPSAAVAPPVADSRLRVRILPGLAQAEPPDVMRGEETQLAGVLALAPGFEGVAVLPGTHTKWARLQQGRVTEFASFMTGEIFALLAGRSVLRHGVASEGWEEAEFLEGAARGFARPEAIAVKLFRIRAEGLLRGLDPVAARSRLSGLLIGAELAAARSFWMGETVALVGSPGISRAYAAALRAQSAEVLAFDAAETTRAGLAAAWSLWKGSPA